MFSDQSAELSLNTSCRSIASVSADRVHHRFLVGTSTASSSSFHNQDDDDDDDDNNKNNVTRCPNSIYLLRFHEELNELGIDGILRHPTGEIWSMSSCPYDKGLVLTCGGGGVGNGGARTKLWRIPQSIIENEDELEYLPDDGVGVGGGGGSLRDSDGHGDSLRQSEISADGGGVGGGGGVRGRKSRTSMEEIVELRTNQQPKGSMTTVGSDLFRGRLSSILWNPLSSSSSAGYFDPTSGYISDEDDGFDGNTDDDNVDNSANGDVLTLDYAGNIFRWDIGTSDAKEVQHFSLLSSLSSPVPAATILSSPPRMAWDPHDTDQIAVSQSKSVKLYDLRTSSVSASIPSSCHRYGITDLDYNPNKTHTLVTSGRDGLIKFWDLRFLSSGDVEAEEEEKREGRGYKRIKPIKIIRGGHTHWSTTVKYNTFHDQLMLSGGTDSIVNLWRISSVSSAPLLELEDDDDDDLVEDENDLFGENEGKDGNEDNYLQKITSQSLDDEQFGRDSNKKSPSKKGNQNKKGARIGNNAGDGKKSTDDSSSAPDVRVSSHIHTDAVYDVTWSAVDAWVFASLSYDGNVILNHVPSKEKYKILL